MFKRGGSSYQSQGTGITSPYDTPRRGLVQQPGGYAGTLPTWADWEAKTRETTKDPRGDFSYAAQGFSSLGNPYKESGEAKTIGEMLWEGAQNVRGSKDKAQELERKGELAILESQGGRMLSEEERAWKEEQAILDRELKLQVAKEKGTYPDMHPGKLYDTYLNKWKTDLGKNTQGPGVYTHPGWEVVEKNIESFVDADIVIRSEKVKSYTSGQKSLAQSVPPVAFKEDGTVDITLLSGGVVYYNPISKEWFTVSNAGTESAEPIVVESYIDGWNNIDPSTSSDSSQKTVDELSETDETIKTKKKEAKKYTKEDYETNVAEGWEGTKKGLKERFTFKGNITEGVNPYKPEADQAVTELDELKGWWNDQAWNKDEG